ncbi:MAG: Sirohydrochlorin cobaltochelatase, F430 biosynthesis enzyme CfbA [Candidatus Methanolliviera sp. GoM_asphalt]|nr:MAG: Sirohydrochlorin cobaltochelatase, F430 biosynthesis enzyme CfbA [Candidatus Methanolliviera sp. GoM_asphalt]
MDEDIGLLIVGHGSSLKYNKELVKSAASEFSEEFENVEVGFLNLQEPKIKDGIDKLLEKGVSKIVVFPLFLARGVHTLKDIPRELGLEDGESKGKIKFDGREVDIFYARPIENDKRLAEIALDRIKEAMP